MMNFPSDADGKNSEKLAGRHSCLCPQKAFTSHRLLANHVRTHHLEIKSAWRKNLSGSPSNPIGNTSNSLNPISSDQPRNSCGGVGNNLIFPKCSCSKKSSSVHVSRTFAPFGSTTTTDFSLDPSSSLGLNGVCQLSAMGRTYQDNKPFFYGRTLEISQHNPSNKEGCWYKMEGPLTCKEGKRMYPVDALGNTDLMSASKRPKIAPNMPVEIEKSQYKELPLLKHVENSFDAEQEVPADIDLSLHL